jgi:tRNA(Arg) A34 adenosine deaminase TadA
MEKATSETNVEDLIWMKEALRMAGLGIQNGEVPVGCIFVLPTSIDLNQYKVTGKAQEESKETTPQSSSQN